MNYHRLMLEIEADIALLTINQPEKLNPLGPDTLDELTAAVTALEQDDAVKVVIITGAGEKAFVAGGDLAFMQTLNALEARTVARKAQQLFNAIENNRKIYLAAINGYALGAGCELAMACDLRIAAEEARLGQPEVNLGILPGWGGTQRLPRLVGKGKAKEMMLTGSMIDAREAERIGLVNRVTKKEELLPVTKKTAQQIAAKSQLAVRLIKEAVDNGLEMEINKAFAYEADLFALCFTGHDQKEGMRAFLEKRDPVWRDC